MKRILIKLKSLLEVTLFKKQKMKQLLPYIMFSSQHDSLQKERLKLDLKMAMVQSTLFLDHYSALTTPTTYAWC